MALVQWLCGGEGEYYSNARWYDPTLGRFITEDPARDGDNWFAYVENNPLRYVDPTGLLSADRIVDLVERANTGDMKAAQMAASYMEASNSPHSTISKTAREEIIRAKTLAESGAAYGNTPGLGGTVVSMDLGKYDCTGAMSAVAQKPYQSTAELSDSTQSGEHYDKVAPKDYSAGDWVVVRYQEAGKTEVEGHSQMKMGGGKYFDSASGLGPRISEKPVEKYLEETKAVVRSVTYLRPKENEWK